MAHRYILFDGDVDALWVENMNSVMDDNKLLTLANGERIRLQGHCALLFEVVLTFFLVYWYCCVSLMGHLPNKKRILIIIKVGDLQYASPATVSRCGMVFVDPKNLRYTPYWQKWLANRPERVWHKATELNSLFGCLYLTSSAVGTRSSQHTVWEICSQVNRHDCGRYCGWQTGPEIKNYCTSDRFEYGELMSNVINGSKSQKGLCFGISV